MADQHNQLPIVGLTMASVVQDGVDQITFNATDGRSWVMYHSQECCESVEVEDICGELGWLVGSTITQADEESRDAGNDKYGTWTFYRIGTAKGLVVIRWLGQSNGYYSERVNFTEVRE